ncbi:MAG: hypothetical protein U5N85_13760 [Arcicella sp.]|nr:hypothetical protein [Arcicella sp.]
MQKLLLFPLFLFIPFLTFSQTDTTQTKTEDMNFDSFGDADDKKIKTYCTQKVNYLSPTKTHFHWLRKINYLFI